MIWDPTIPRRCWSASTLQALAFTHAALNIFTDFIFAVVIPIPLLWGLQMNRKTKAAVMVVLSLGVFVCLAGILRIPTIENYGKAGDFLWDSRGLTIWFMAEFNTGIMAGSIPTLRPVFKSVLASTYIKGRSRRYGYGDHTGPSGTQNRSFSSKGFNNLPNRDESFSHDQVNDYDSTISQKGLVVKQEPIGLGVIKKDVTTTITHMDGPTMPKARAPAWDV